MIAVEETKSNAELDAIGCADCGGAAGWAHWGPLTTHEITFLCGACLQLRADQYADQCA